MNVINAFPSRTLRLASVPGFFLAGLFGPPQAAFAGVDPDGPYPYPAAGVAFPVQTASPSHSATSSGLAVWIVIIVGIGAVILGVALAELVRSVARYRRTHRLVAA